MAIQAAIGLAGAHSDLDGYIDWLQEANNYKIITYWTKNPTGLDTTMKDLEICKEKNGHFLLYYIKGSKVRCRLNVIDYETDIKLIGKNNNSNQYAYPERWKTLNSDWGNGYIEEKKNVAIFFLCDQFCALNERSSELDFGNSGSDYSLPVRENLQPVRNIIYSVEERAIMNAHAILQSSKQIILTGPPGTGKTYFAKRLAAQMIGCHPDDVKLEEEKNTPFARARFPKVNDNGSWALVQFHPSYNYEDFVRGIQVSTNQHGQPNYEVENRILAQMADEARKGPNESKEYVIIIDEINRANLAAVLGELIYALEYRGCSVDTPYAISGDRTIKIPSNLYIIGTMNTADRTVGHIDYAVRRRFAFLPVLPDDNNIPTDKGKKLFNKVASLFETSESNPAETLSPEFHPDDVKPGHTYFMSPDENILFQKFAYQVYPLLREYYKDGILIPAGSDGLVIEVNDKVKIDIKNHTAPEDVLKSVREGLS